MLTDRNLRVEMPHLTIAVLPCNRKPNCDMKINDDLAKRARHMG